MNHAAIVYTMRAFAGKMSWYGIWNDELLCKSAVGSFPAKS